MNARAMTLPSLWSSRPTAVLSLRVRRAVAISIEVMLVVAANRYAFALRFDDGAPAWALAAWLQMLPWLLAVRAVTFGAFGLHKRLWRYTGIYDLKAVVEAVLLSTVAFAAIAMSPLGPSGYPRSIFIIDAVVLTVLLCGARVACRVEAEFSGRARAARDSTDARPDKRLLIVGAGDAGEMLVHDIRSKAGCGYQPIGFVDDDAAKRGVVIHGVPVLGHLSDLPAVLAAHRPDEILVASRNADPGLLRTIVGALGSDVMPIKVLPRLRDMLDGNVGFRHAQSLNFEDLLSRAPVGLDAAPVRRLIAGRRVLVTGAGGSIGSELCRQIARMSPASLVMLDRYENGLHAVHVELTHQHPECAIRPVIADVTDAHRLDAVFAEDRPELVFHAAAHKHVPLMEGNPCEAIKNNVTGTRRLAAVAERYGTERVILISTDKAVNPVNAMGASKRLAELVCRGRRSSGRTRFAAVRFGNVLGSNGSVIPLFLEQIRSGGPVTVTHPDVRRFFMLIPEAVQLVLHAAAQAEDGAIFVLEMGEQVKVVDMARHLIRLSGLVPDKDVPIEFIGLRPGEKLEEQLVGTGETLCPSGVAKILRVKDTRPTPIDLMTHIALLEERARLNDTAGVLALLPELLADWRPVAAAAGTAAEPSMNASRAAVRRHLAWRTCRVCGTGRVTKVNAQTVTRSGAETRRLACDTCGWHGSSLNGAAHGSLAFAN